jgi:3-isopropylmalate/(R)-2-methylmalate dehydratase small subunit
MVSEVKVVTGRAVPLVGNDIDTDRIIPARYLKCVTFDGLGAGVFADDRTQRKGQHPFDLSQYQGAEILVVNRNFGCGSSREHAPQALAKWGIRAIVGESFAEIFFGNCLAMGIPCLTVDTETASALQALIVQEPGTIVAVDLEKQEVQAGDFVGALSLGEGPRQMLVSGQWDATGQLVANAAQTQATVSHLPYVSWKVGAIA